MQNARNSTPQNFADDCRSSERRDAVQMVSSTAELLASIAKLKGEFSHNYIITRTSEKERERERLRSETGLENHPNFREFTELLEPDEVEALSDEEREDYFRHLKLPPLDIRRRPVPEPAVPPPPPENAGSNTHAAES